MDVGTEKGTLSIKSGNKYVGEFKGGVFHGHGTYTYANGTVNQGIWENGEFLYARKLSHTMTAKKKSNRKPIVSNIRMWEHPDKNPACSRFVRKS